MSKLRKWMWLELWKEPGDDEIGKAVLNLRLGKAVRKDGIPMKAWRYGNKEKVNGNHKKL